MMKRALGVDFGNARIGLAISDEIGVMAHPLRTLAVKDGKMPERVRDVCVEFDVGWVILGLPRNMDGSEGEASRKAREFADSLRPLLNCPVILWDERMTTLAAQRALHEAGRDTRSSRSVIDQVAAQMILQGWMDSGAMS